MRQPRIGDVTVTSIVCRQPERPTIFDCDVQEGIRSRRGFLGDITATGTFASTIYFPGPTVGLVEPMGDAFDYKFVR